jgi:transposase
MASFLSPSPKTRPVRRRTRRDPKPHYKPDISTQMDGILGCPAAALRKEHVARFLKPLVWELDLTPFDKERSSLGRHGYDPRHVLGVWVLASLMGLHHATVVEASLETDAGLRYMAGGHSMSAGVLKRFRARAGALEQLIQQTLRLAVEKGLIELKEVAVDGVRLRAHASIAAVRTESRSTKRLKALAAVDVKSLSSEERERHEAKVQKHQEALKLCAAAGQSNVVVTNPGAALMKFPNGASAPGHHVTVAAAGVTERFVVAALVDKQGNDYGELEPILRRARKELEAAGFPTGVRIQAAADAGYFSKRDLLFAQGARPTTDILITEPPHHDERGRQKGLFSRERFVFGRNGVVRCPAGKRMLGPTKDGRGRVEMRGDGCATCPLKPSCTRGKVRTLAIDQDFEDARTSMRARMNRKGARDRYNQRIATIEPVFSYLEDRMQFRRVSTRHEKNSVSEILLKLLAYNLVRLVTATRRLSCVHFTLANHSWTGAFLLETELPN